MNKEYYIGELQKQINFYEKLMEDDCLKNIPDLISHYKGIIIGIQYSINLINGG